MTTLSIRPAELADADAYAAHVVRSAAESGREGSPVFAIERHPVRRDVRDAAELRWARELDEAAWGRAFLLIDKDSGVVGHVELRGGRFAAELHRATLDMAVERGFQNRGDGRRLLTVAIAWAREQAQVAWIDLGVFAENRPARALYERAGFATVGVRADAFRIEGARAQHDVVMTLELRGPARG